MSRQQANALGARWDQALVKFSLDALRRGHPVSPFGSFEGRVDLRGVVVEESPRVRVDAHFELLTKLFSFEVVDVRDVDLSYAVVPSVRATEATFTNCVFDHAELPDFRSWSARYIGCSFRFANLQESLLGAKEKGNDSGTLFQACDFTGADLREAGVKDGRFSGCIFVGTRWFDTQCRTAVFENCDFREADIRSVVFDGRKFDENGFAGLGENRMAGCDFSTSRIRDTRFIGIDRRNIVALDSKRYPPVDNFPMRAIQALDSLKADGGPEAQLLATLCKSEFIASTAMPPDSVGILEFGILSDSEAQLLADALGISV